MQQLASFNIPTIARSLTLSSTSQANIVRITIYHDTLFLSIGTYTLDRYFEFKEGTKYRVLARLKS